MHTTKLFRTTTALAGGILIGLTLPVAVLAQTETQPAAVKPAEVQPTQAPSATTPAQGETPAPTREASDGQTATVTVQGQKPQNRIDRQAYDMKQEIDVQSGTATEALNKVPSVNVDPEGNVTLRGNSNVQVYIDGKPSARTNSDNRAATLQSMAGADIDSIEVMNNPGAQFSAEGSGGIINIVMRRNRAPGNSGSVIANVGSQSRYNLTFSGARNSGDLTLSGGFSYRDDGRDGRNSSIQQRFDNSGNVISERIQDGDNSNRFKNLSLNGSIDYNISDADSVSTQFGYGKRNFDSEGTTVFSGFTGTTPLDYIRASSGEGDREDTSASIRWDHKGDQPAETLKVDLRVSTSKGGNTNLATNDYPTGSDFREIRDSSSTTANGTFSIDYARNVGDGVLALGTQTTLDDNSFVNSSELPDCTTGSTLPDCLINRQLNSEFEYRQLVYAFYGTYQMPLGEKWVVMGGLRSETIDLKSRQYSLDYTYNPAGARVVTFGETSYTKLVPSAFATYTLTDNSKLRFSYSHRLRRPNPQDLNPFLTYIDPQNVQSGNPDLEPSESDSFEAGYEYSKEQTSYELRAYYRKTTNQITDVSLFIEDGVLLTTKQNLGEAQTSGLEFNYNNRLWTKLSLRINGNVGYEELETATNGTQSGVTVRGRVSADYQVTPKDRIQLSFFTSGRQLSGQGYREPFSRGNLSYRHQLNPKLAFTATVDDVFRTSSFKNIVDTPNIYSVSSRSMAAPTFYIGLSYILGGAPGQQPQGDQQRWQGGGRGNWGGPMGGPGGPM